MANQKPRSLASDNWRRRDDVSRSQSHPTRYSRTRFHKHGGPVKGQLPARGAQERSWEASSSKDPPSKPSDGEGQAESLVEGSNALEEGRRIYMGNILYQVRPEEILQALDNNGLARIEKIHVSIDPMNGRNPGYCFVEFPTRSDANTAIIKMKGVTIRGRPFRTGPCEPKGREKRWKGHRKPLFTRWGNWDPDGGNIETNSQGPAGAEEHLLDVVRNWKNNRFRVFVGGLGKMINQVHNDQELREIFQGFDIATLGKRIFPREDKRLIPGKHHFAFVDLESKQEAERAIIKLNGRLWNGGRLKVRMPMDLPQKLEERALPLDLEGNRENIDERHA